ncbi:hypothetical protein ACLB2K_035193 [Fragaria x ananassa]
MKKTTEPPHGPQQKQHHSSSEEETGLGHNTVQKPYLLQLPDNTIFDIHCRIPIKTLIKCRRVCNPWRSLLSDPLFTKGLFARTPACHLVRAMGRYYLLNFNDASTPNGVTALQTRFLNSSDGFVGSCNGFLCLYNKERNRLGFFISNPITGESLALPKAMKPNDPPPIYCGPSADAITHENLAFLDSFRPKSVEELVFQSCSAFGFGFSPISDVYKVVVFTKSRLFEVKSPREFRLSRGPEKVTVLTVGSGSWRHIEDSVMGEFDHQSGIFLNGYLHWIGRTTLVGSRFIYAFCIESESFKELPLPPWTVDSNKTRCNLGVLNGCLSIIVDLDCNVNVWVMKDYGVKESWAKELDIRVEYGAASCLSTQALNFSKERQVLLLQNRLQAHIPGSRGFVGIEVDGMNSSIDASCLYVPSFVSLKVVFGDQNLEPGRSEKLRVREAGELQQLAPNETKLGMTGTSEDQSVTSQRGQGNVKANAVDHGNAEADQQNLLCKAGGLNQGIVRSKAAVVEQKQQAIRVPSKAETTHRARPMQDSASSLSSLPTQPSVSQPLTGNQFIHPITKERRPSCL